MRGRKESGPSYFFIRQRKRLLSDLAWYGLGLTAIGSNTFVPDAPARGGLAAVFGVGLLLVGAAVIRRLRGGRSAAHGALLC